MCWQDWKIGAQLRQKRIDYRNGDVGGTITFLPPNNRRFGIVVHGAFNVEVRAAVYPGQNDGPIIGLVGPSSDPGSVWPGTLTRSTVLSVAELGNDFRGALRINATLASEDNVGEVSELEWCGPESVDGGL